MYESFFFWSKKWKKYDPFCFLVSAYINLNFMMTFTMNVNIKITFLWVNSLIISCWYFSMLCLAIAQQVNFMSLAFIMISFAILMPSRDFRNDGTELFRILIEPGRKYQNFKRVCMSVSQKSMLDMRFKSKNWNFYN